MSRSMASLVTEFSSPVFVDVFLKFVDVFLKIAHSLMDSQIAFQYSVDRH